MSEKGGGGEAVSPGGRTENKVCRLDELNILLNLDSRKSEMVDGDVGEEAGMPPTRDGRLDR